MKAMNGSVTERQTPIDPNGLNQRSGADGGAACCRFRRARPEDAQQVLALYRNVMGSGFCVWNDGYPTMAEITHDLETGNLYVLAGSSGLVGAISVVPENEMDGFDCWTLNGGREIARVVIDRAWQGRGLAGDMVAGVTEVLRESGCRSIRLAVVKGHLPACKTYRRAGFAVVGQARMYGNDYELMEKILG